MGNRFPPGQKTLQLIEESIRRPLTLDDEVLLSTVNNALREQIGEVNPETLKGTLDALTSQLRQIVWGNTPNKRWTDLPPSTLLDQGSYGNRIINHVPNGILNKVNVDFTTAHEFLPGSLEVWLGSMKLTPNLDYEEYLNFQGFKIKPDPLRRGGLKSPPSSSETVIVNYSQRTIF